MELEGCLTSNHIIGDAKISRDCMRVQEFEAGQEVLDHIDGIDCIGIIACGRVQVKAVSLDGKDIHLNTLEEGDCFGISNLLTMSALQTTLSSVDQTTILYIPKENLLTAMEEDANLAIRYAKYCNERIQFLLQRIEFLTVQTAKNKLILYLLAQSDDQGTISLECRREELANRFGISRAALFRELSYLQKEGVLQSTKGNLTIMNLAKLKELAREYTCGKEM
ncbi:MAG: Crp/Fnr family transcriptional regulator [Eubacteriales bacterium]